MIIAVVGSGGKTTRIKELTERYRRRKIGSGNHHDPYVYRGRYLAER